MFAGRHNSRRKQRGAVLVLIMIFLVVFSALAAALATSSGVNVQVASNQHRGNGALHAAQSGLECAKYIVRTVTLPETSTNTVSDAQANTVWTNLCAYLQARTLDGKAVSAASRFTDAHGAGDQIVTQTMDYGTPLIQLTIRLYRYDSDRRTIKVQSIGTNGSASRLVAMDLAVTKDREVLTYAVAGRGRMWLTGNTTIHGDVFSTWSRAGISPFNITSDSSVRGTINTVRTLSQIQNDTYRLETLDGDNQPIDIHGNPLVDNYAERYHNSSDEVQGYHEGINYGQPYDNMPGLNINDYNTDAYKTGLTSIAASATKVTEYFPHAAGNYGQPRDGGSTSFSRNVYENQTFSNTILPVNRHALFKNCTFQNTLYIDASKTSTSKSYTNNVRFENCTFNGVLVTNTPQSFNWINNALYFTGQAAFNNQSSVQEATILAPHFNVNLGNTNPQPSENNVLTGAIVGGIVDVRGNAQIYGTIISMCDTSQWPSGYVTNIGATLGDGGSETTEVGDIGVISITPEKDTMLPSGIMSPIVIKPKPQTYSEGL
jgi:Tfp pilus assembly protein PilX